MEDEQPCDVYRYLIRQLHASEQKYVKLLNELQRDRRDERLERDELRRELEMNNKAKIERDELRKELETNKANIDKLDRLYKYSRETHRKTINKEVIINIIKGVNI
jgi:DNA repair exonuclease SbcCD nuclease subunit